ncbi:MAG: hypothetical protein KJ893_07175 [Candidatus Omnitrophica bacterium]|nr:hypothetical protein [Candidatus Omnitrophota bacterium]MBU4479639.1 hypothetical protein [Candidatus Omnitrophota bacterium]MCG2703532.1 hypothetical protein [Candidatus Omnitrophota bacterium]
MKKYRNFFLGLLFVLLSACPSFAQSEPAASTAQIAGELFATPVPAGNYYFAKRVVMTYAAKWRGSPKDEKELEDLVWQELLFSFEAFRRGIEVNEAEVDEEIDRLLKENKVDFNWRLDKEKYQQWVQDNLGVPLDVFRNQMQHLIKLEKLRKQVIDGFNPEVTEEEAYRKFLDEYNTLSVELVQFDDLERAQKFFNEVHVSVPEAELDRLIWKDLLFSFEAAKRKIAVDDAQVDKAIEMLLWNDDVRFRWKDDAESFRAWVNEKFGIQEDIFLNRMRQLVKINALIGKVAKKEEPDVDTEGTYRKFLEKNGTLSVAYWNFLHTFVSADSDVLCFDTLNQAKTFYKEIKRDAGFWGNFKRKEPDKFKQPGFVALDFLIHMWGFKREDAYAMLDKAVDSYYPPASIYKGYGVFKILRIRKADAAEYENRKESYVEKVKSIKKYEAYQEWVKEFKKEANIKVYIH